jgi:hypothetical protein
MYAEYLAKLVSELVDAEAEKQRATYLALKPHADHDLFCRLDGVYNVTYAKCLTCDVILIGEKEPDHAPTD